MLIRRCQIHTRDDRALVSKNPPRIRQGCRRNVVSSRSDWQQADTSKGHLMNTKLNKLAAVAAAAAAVAAPAAMFTGAGTAQAAVRPTVTHSNTASDLQIVRNIPPPPPPL
jgi:hypothetical protein